MPRRGKGKHAAHQPAPATLLSAAVFPSVQPANTPYPLKKAPRWFLLAAILVLPAFGAFGQSAPTDQPAATAQPAPAAPPAPPARPAYVYHVPTYQELLDTALLQSVMAHRTDHVERLLQLGANTSALSATGLGFTPLHQAVANGDAPMVELLLKHGADPSVASKRGVLPIAYVFESQTSVENQVKILRLLAAHGADINNTGKNAYSLPVDAIGTHDIAALNAVLALKPNLDALTPGGQTAAYIAATYGYADFLDALVVAGANYTPTLGTVAALGDLDKVNQMLADGADPNTPDSRKVEPIVYAAYGGHTNVVEALLTAGADKDVPALTSALHRAVEQNHLAAADLLIRAGADVNAAGGTSSIPTTPLVVAATNGNLSMVKLLNDSVEKLDGALIAAAQNNHADVVSYLLDKGADPYETRARSKLIPLMYAAFGGHASIVDLLLKRTAHAYTQDELDQALDDAVGGCVGYYDRPANAFVFDGKNIVAGTPAPDALHDTPAAYQQTIALLATQGAHANTPMNSGDTPLMVAVDAGDAPLVSLLLDQVHADPNFVNGNNETALYLVSHQYNSNLRTNRLKILTLLLDHGADITRERFSNYRNLSQNPANANSALLAQQQDEQAWTAKYIHQVNLNVLDDFLLSVPAPDNREAVKLLLSHGASFRPTGGNQTEDLIRAVAVGDQAKARQLVAAGADVNQPFRNNWTPLLVACAVGDLDMIKLLLDAKADLSAMLGLSTARNLAVTSENPEVIRYVFSEYKARQISTRLGMLMLDGIHSPEAAKAYLAMSSSPAEEAQGALREIARRSIPPDTFGVILAALPPISPPAASAPDADGPTPATPVDSSSAASGTTPDSPPTAAAP
jgi:cytohesin